MSMCLMCIIFSYNKKLQKRRIVSYCLWPSATINPYKAVITFVVCMNCFKVNVQQHCIFTHSQNMPGTDNMVFSGVFLWSEDNSFPNIDRNLRLSVFSQLYVITTLMKESLESEH